MKNLPGTGTVIKRSRAYYVTIPKPVFKEMRLRVGDRVKVEYEKFYKQIIISKEIEKDESIPFKHIDT